MIFTLMPSRRGVGLKELTATPLAVGQAAENLHVSEIGERRAALGDAGDACP